MDDHYYDYDSSDCIFNFHASDIDKKVMFYEIVKAKGLTKSLKVKEKGNF